MTTDTNDPSSTTTTATATATALTDNMPSPSILRQEVSEEVKQLLAREEEQLRVAQQSRFAEFNKRRTDFEHTLDLIERSELEYKDRIKFEANQYVAFFIYRRNAKETAKLTGLKYLDVKSEFNYLLRANIRTPAGWSDLPLRFVDLDMYLTQFPNIDFYGRTNKVMYKEKRDCGCCGLTVRQEYIIRVMFEMGYSLKKTLNGMAILNSSIKHHRAYAYTKYLKATRLPAQLSARCIANRIMLANHLELGAKFYDY